MQSQPPCKTYLLMSVQVDILRWRTEVDFQVWTKIRTTKACTQDQDWTCKLTTLSYQVLQSAVAMFDPSSIYFPSALKSSYPRIASGRSGHKLLLDFSHLLRKVGNCKRSQFHQKPAMAPRAQFPQSLLFLTFAPLLLAALVVPSSASDALPVDSTANTTLLPTPRDGNASAALNSCAYGSGTAQSTSYSGGVFSYTYATAGCQQGFYNDVRVDPVSYGFSGQTCTHSFSLSDDGTYWGWDNLILYTSSGGSCAGANAQYYDKMKTLTGGAGTTGWTATTSGGGVFCVYVHCNNSPGYQCVADYMLQTVCTDPVSTPAPTPALTPSPPSPQYQGYSGTPPSPQYQGYSGTPPSPQYQGYSGTPPSPQYQGYSGNPPSPRNSYTPSPPSKFLHGSMASRKVDPLFRFVLTVVGNDSCLEAA